MRKYIFKCIEDWYSAQRILGTLPVSYNSYIEDDHWIIEL